MSLKSILPQILTSPGLQTMARTWHAARRNLRGEQPVLHAFIERDDPYSHLLIQALPRLAEAHSARIVWHEVGAPDPSAAPEPEKLADWARRDAGYLAEAYGLDAGETEFPACSDPTEGEILRERLGHYGSAMTWYEGEWYWGVDRLHHLETRLGADEPIFAPVAEPDQAEGGEIDVFISLRSPYTYIAAMRMFSLADRWNATVNLRPVLPMVMRALPIPRSKRFYIVRDCKREADRLGIPFGKIADPVGPGVERGLAILCREIAEGRGQTFFQAFMTAVFSRGVDPATDAGLRKICAAGGVPWAKAQECLGSEGWRESVEANRQALFELGLWGVPSFRVGDRAAFGQDRLWLVGRWLGGN